VTVGLFFATTAPLRCTRGRENGAYCAFLLRLSSLSWTWALPAAAGLRRRHSILAFQPPPCGLHTTYCPATGWYSFGLRMFRRWRCRQSFCWLRAGVPERTRTAQRGVRRVLLRHAMQPAWHCVAGNRTCGVRTAATGLVLDVAFYRTSVPFAGVLLGSPAVGFPGRCLGYSPLPGRGSMAARLAARASV